MTAERAILKGPQTAVLSHRHGAESIGRGDASQVETIRVTTRKLFAYCYENHWAGHDPYDALNSRLFQALPLLDSKWPRLILTQAFKRSPVSLRGLALVPKTQNPKALALFLQAILNLSNVEALDQEGIVEKTLLDRLIELRSPNMPYWCWGYSFPWQTRTITVPRGAPNLVCTTFVGEAILDLYERRHDPRLLAMAESAANYLLDELYWTDGSVASFSYPLRSLRSQTHNANFLAAALLCRVHRHTGETRFLDRALEVARCSATKQRHDGSWVYSEGPSGRWIDNFHTGYNLGALQSISRAINSDEFAPHIRRGFDFYRAHFFRSDGAARYFHDRTYPIDIHCVAQSIITLVTFKHLDAHSLPLAHSVFQWAMKHMWNNRGFFYYRVLRSCTITTSYMRWSQAWMLLALSTLLRDSHDQVGPEWVSAESCGIHG